jgi:hypothetical protein
MALKGFLLLWIALGSAAQTFSENREISRLDTRRKL